MRRLSPLVFIAFLSYHVAIAQNRLLWTAISSPINAQITDARSFAVDSRGNNFSINYTQSALSLYDTYVFYAHDANGLKLWEYVNDSCLTDCNDKYFNIIPVEEHGAIFIGAFDDITGTQIRIKRIDENGSLLWEQYWISPFLSARPVVSMLDNNGNIIVGLSATVNLTDQEDFAVARFDTTNGYLDWHIELPDNGSIPDTYSEIIQSMKIDSNNDIYLVGNATNLIAGVKKNYFFRINSGGGLDYINESSYSGVDSYSTSIDIDNSSHFYTFGFDGTSPVVEKRNSANGNLSWSETITKDSAALSNVDFHLTGNSLYCANNFSYFVQDSGGGHWLNNHYLLTKFDLSGNVQYQKDYFTEVDSIAPQDHFGGLTQFTMCDNGLYFLSAQHLDPATNIMIIHKTDDAGITLWFDTASADQSPGFFGCDAQCDAYVTRTFNNENLTQKFSSTPLNLITSARETTSFTLYPNPATDKIRIDRFAEELRLARYFLYDNLGKLISGGNLMSDEISVADMHPGIYFLEVISSENKIFKASFIKS